MRLPRDIRPYGPTGLLLEWEARIADDLSRSVHAFARALRTRPEVEECVPGYASLLVTFDPRRTSAGSLRECIYDLRPAPGVQDSGQLHRIPVVYGGAFGPDLAAVSVATGLREEEITHRHTDVEYLVFLLGFRPGFAFMGQTDAALTVARRAQPRARVPAGSVGLAGRQTGVYPPDCPGGWQLIGCCPWPLLDLEGRPRFRPGDRVRFFAIGPEDFAAYQTDVPWPTH